MADAFDFTDVFQEIEGKIREIMGSSEAKQKLREIMSRYAASDVYGQYFPTMFHRQYLLSQPGNYEVSSGGMTMTVENTAMSEEVFNRIESGSGYTWRGSQIYQMQPFPRPYSQHGIDGFTDEWLIPEIERQVFQR